MMTITNTEWNIPHCTGCSACASSCPKGALTMEPDALGFLRPRLIPEQCVECHRCEQACPVLHPPKGSSAAGAVAAHAQDEALLEQCSSGGVFPLLAKEVLSRGGVVYGASFDEDFHVQHIRVDAAQDLPRLYGSKYVQSNLRDSFRQAKSDLNDGRPVYFSGTPCQIAGFKSFLGRDYDHLMTQDLVCHSVPAPEIWQSYKQQLESQQQSRLTFFSFRRKTSIREQYNLYGEFKNGTIVELPSRTDPYMQGFIKGLYSRESCYHCPFKGFSRCSDLTLGDFWGAHSILPEAYHPKGTSVALLHTEKAKRLLESVCLNTHALSPESAFLFNPAVLKSTAKPKRYEFFHAHRSTTDFSQLVAHCCKSTFREKMQKWWNQSLPYRFFCKIRRLITD